MALTTEMFRELVVGTTVELKGRHYRIADIQLPKIFLTRVGDGGLVDYSVSDLFEDAKFLDDCKTVCDENIVEPNILETLKPHIREEVEFKESLALTVMDFVNAKETGTIDEFLQKHNHLFPKGTTASSLTQIMVIEALAHKANVSASTVSRCYYPYKKFGLKGIIPKHGAGISARKDNKLLVIRNPYNHKEILQSINVRFEDPDVIGFIQKSIERDFLKHKPNLSVSAVITRINAACSAKGKKKPIKSTLYKIFDKIEPRHIARFRGDKKEQQKYKDVSRGYSNEAEFPGHIIELDHKKIDVILVDDNNETIGRAWLTVGIDLYSRMVWGFHLSFDEPSIDKLIKVLENGTFIKRAKQLYGTNNDWPFFGKPKIFHFDNGKDFRSKEIERVVKEVFGAEIIYRPIRRPEYGGAVERFFRTMDMAIYHNLDGTTKSNPADLKGVNPEEMARVTLEQAIAITVKWIVDKYHFKDHDGLPKDRPMPMAMFLDGQEISGLLPFVLPEDEQAFKLELMQQTTRQYTRDGISLDTIHYKAVELSIFRGTKTKLTVKFDNSDISKIFVFHPDKKVYIVAYAVYQDGLNLSGMSKAYYNWYMSQKKKQGDEWRQKLEGARNLDKSEAELDSMMYDGSTKRGRKIKAINKANGNSFVPSKDADELEYEEWKKMVEAQED